jgi:pSer/pThr/pTyr-binding forkhead associated (FHA) protein
MKPLGGGDPVPLRKNELIVGRRPSCDICLDFENISGKHCVLRYMNQVWHVRDLGSTNGTSLNGARLSSEHVVLPDDELGIAGHIFHIDYEPGAPESILKREQLMEEAEVPDSAPKRHSLIELAGLDTDGDRVKRPKRQTKAPERIERMSAEEGEFEDALPADVKAKPAPKPAANNNDDDFLKLIEEDVIKPK